MSPSAYITVRTTQSGKRFVVRYRNAGRYSRLIHAGSFRTQKDARARRDFVISELAAGRDPMVTLRARETAPKPLTIAELGPRWLAGRVDLEESTRQAHATRLRKIADQPIGRKHPGEITVADVQEWLSSLGMRPGSVRQYLSTLRQVIDDAEVEPNPARSKRIRLEKVEVEEVNPPPAAHVLAILDRIHRKPMRLVLVTLEQTAMRIGETVSLAWGDVDVAGSRFRIRARETKTGRAKWVQVPDWLMALIEETCPLEDRTPGRRVFQGVTNVGCRQAMGRACLAAGIPHYHPHDLRHRRASLWHGQGVTNRELAERGGWTNATLPLNTYTHVMPLDEAAPEALISAVVRSR